MRGAVQVPVERLVIKEVPVEIEKIIEKVVVKEVPVPVEKLIEKIIEVRRTAAAHESNIVPLPRVASSW